MYSLLQGLFLFVLVFFFVVVFKAFLSLNSERYCASVVQTGSFVSIYAFVSNRLLHMVMRWKSDMLSGCPYHTQTQ